MGQGNMSRTFGGHGNTGFITSPGSVPAMYDGGRSPRNRTIVAEDTRSNYAYAPKSKLLYNRKGVNSAASQRSKTGGSKLKQQVGPYVGETASKQGDTKSQLNQFTMKRFNEAVPEGGPKSITKSVFSKPRSQIGSKIGSNAARSIFSQQ